MPDLGLHKTLSRVSGGQERDSLASPPPCWTFLLPIHSGQGSIRVFGYVLSGESFKILVTQTSLTKCSGSPNKQKDMSMRTGLVGMRGVCVTGVRDIEDGGDGVHIMHHTDTWSYQATNWTNLKVGLGLKLGITASKTFVCSSQDAELYFYGTYWLSVPTHASDLHLQRLLLESRLSHFNYWHGVCYTTKSSL